MISIYKQKQYRIFILNLSTLYRLTTCHDLNLSRTLLGLGVSWCRTRVMSDTDTTPTLVITLNYAIFTNYLLCRRVGVRVVSVSVFVLHSWCTILNCLYTFSILLLSKQDQSQDLEPIWSYKSTTCGGRIPNLWKHSLWVIGKWWLRLTLGSVNKTQTTDHKIHYLIDHKFIIKKRRASIN